GGGPRGGGKGSGGGGGGEGARSSTGGWLAMPVPSPALGRREGCGRESGGVAPWGAQCGAARASAPLRQRRDRDHLRTRPPRRLLGLEEAPEDRPGGAALGVEPVRDARVAVGDGDPVARAGAELH